MKNSLLIAMTMATLLTGTESRAQTITLDASSKAGRQALCRLEWQKVKDDPKLINDTQYGSQYFQKQCKAKLIIKQAGNPGAR